MDAVSSQSSDAVERELKFALEPDDTVKLKEHPLLTWIRPTIKSILSTYFDTADHALGNARLALRLRAVDGRIIQTLKLPSVRSCGFFAGANMKRRLRTASSISNIYAAIALRAL